MCSRKSSEKQRHMVVEQQEKYHQAEAEPEVIYTDQDEKPLLVERFKIMDGIRYELKPSHALDHQLLVTKLSSDLQGTYSDEHILSTPKLVCIGIDLKELFQSKMQYRGGTT